MSKYSDIEIGCDDTNLTLSFRDEDGFLRSIGDIPLRKLKFHMDRACASKTWARWEEYGDTK